MILIHLFTGDLIEVFICNYELRVLYVSKTTNSEESALSVSTDRETSGVEGGMIDRHRRCEGACRHDRHCQGNDGVATSIGVKQENLGHSIESHTTTLHLEFSYTCFFQAILVFTYSSFVAGAFDSATLAWKYWAENAMTCSFVSHPCRITALVYSFKISGKSVGTLICSAINIRSVLADMFTVCCVTNTLTNENVRFGRACFLLWIRKDFD